MATKKKSKVEGILDRNIPPVGIKDLKEIIKLKIKTNELTSLMIVGRHGIGKSEAVFQAAKEIGYNVIDKRLSCMEVGDLVGIPVPEGEETKFLRPDWFPIKGEERFIKTILFLDEYLRANRDIKNASMQVILDHKLNGWPLPDDCLVIAAINDGEEYDTVGGLDPAQVDRFQIFELLPSNEEWLTWATEKVDGEEGKPKPRVNSYVTGYIKGNGDYLDPPDFSDDQVEKINKYQSRRSWVKLGKIFDAIGTKPNGGHHALVSSYVGADCATNFIAHCDKVVEMIPAKDVFEGKDVFTGKEEYWEDITRCSKTVYDLVELVAKRTQDSKGMTKQSSDLKAKEFKALSDFLINLKAINPEAAGLYWVKLSGVTPTEELYEKMVMKHSLEPTLAKLFPDTEKKIKEITKNLEKNE